MDDVNRCMNDLQAAMDVVRSALSDSPPDLVSSELNVHAALGRLTALVAHVNALLADDVSVEQAAALRGVLAEADSAGEALREFADLISGKN